MTFVAAMVSVLCAATPVSVTLRLSPGHNAHATVLADKHTAVLSLARAPSDLRQQLVAVGGQQAYIVLPAPAAGVVVYFVFPDAEVRKAVAQIRGKDTVFNIVTENYRDAQAEHVSQPVPAPLGAGDAAAAFEAAQQALLGGRFADAQHRFEALTSVYGLRPWVQLRLADVAFVKGDPSACDAYADVYREYDNRLVGEIAVLRRVFMACPGDPQDYDWQRSLDRATGGNLTHTYVRDEAAWVLRWLRKPAHMRAALALGDNVLSAPLHKLLFRRLLRESAPFSTAALAQPYAALIEEQPNKLDLQLWIARAYCLLDLPAAAAAVVENTTDADAMGFSTPGIDRRWLRDSAARCASDGFAEEARPPLHAPALLKLNDLEERMANMNALAQRSEEQ